MPRPQRKQIALPGLVALTLMAAGSLVATTVHADQEAATPIGDDQLGLGSSWRAELIGAGQGGSGNGAPSYRLSAQDADEAIAQDETPDPNLAGSAAAPRRWWPLALSAVLPGLGESTTGYLRGYPMMAADIASIYASRYYRDQGNDIEVEYEAFADEHWSEDRWGDTFPTSAIFSGAAFDDFGFEAGTTKEEVPLYVSKEEDEREWYENLGKWDVFWYGWDDSQPADLAWGWNDPPPEFMTPNRQTYIDMRNESNDNLKKSYRFLAFSLLLRVFSVLEMAYLEGFIGGRYNEANPSSFANGYLASIGEDKAQLSWFVTPQTWEETRVGLRVTY